MGRPINKKYFGNRNQGSTTTKADDGIGGKGVAGVAITTVSSYQTRPVFSFSAPQLATGVTATATITSEILSATITGGTGGTGTYAVGDLLTISLPGGSATAYVATVNAGAVATVNFTGAGATRGTFTTLPAAGSAVATANETAGSTGEGCTLVLTFRAKEVDITDPGSGYTATATTSGITQGVVLGAVTMTPVTSEPKGSALNPDPAIVARGFTGGSVKVADIVKQQSGIRYRIKTVDTVDPILAVLKTTGAPATADEMTISATDSLGKTYYIARLTAKKATVVPYGAAGHEFPLVSGNPQIVGWTLDNAVSGISVKLENN